jgi:hypothetical protein
VVEAASTLLLPCTNDVNPGSFTSKSGKLFGWLLKGGYRTVFHTRRTTFSIFVGSGYGGLFGYGPAHLSFRMGAAISFRMGLVISVVFSVMVGPRGGPINFLFYELLRRGNFH